MGGGAQPFTDEGNNQYFLAVPGGSRFRMTWKWHTEDGRTSISFRLEPDEGAKNASHKGPAGADAVKTPAADNTGS
jgi:hypothetical protein